MSFTPSVRRVAGVGIVIVATIVAMVLIREAAITSDPIIDTWPVGQLRPCSLDPGRCDELVRVGLAGLDERDRGHATVASWELHAEGALTNAAGKKVLMTRSGGCCSVLVVTLTDDSTRAIGVGHPGISDVAVAVPWETAASGEGSP